jgi:hypothetical protein
MMPKIGVFIARSKKAKHFQGNLLEKLHNSDFIYRHSSLNDGDTF